jgi:exonuclease SbcC
MIPQKLQIKNFLSYGPTLQTIDFSSYSLICLSGKNGHGKSALLDAITWAVWGQARKLAGASKADQGLLRLGQTQMLVIFDFMFNDKTYRIRREYMETYGKPISVLEFGMIDDADNFIPLTDKTIRTTQEKIEQTLRLDFDSFSNSAFLRQGSSNEFSKKSPKDRKQILATILGLDQYEVIRKLALDKIKDASSQKMVLTTLQEKRQQELLKTEALTTQLAQLTDQMNNLTATEQNISMQQQECTQQRQLHTHHQNAYDNLAFQLQQLTATAAEHKQQIKALLTQWRAVQKKKRSLPNNDLLETTKNNIITAITQHQKLFQENLEQQRMLLDLTQQINTIEQQHKNEINNKNHTLLLEIERLHTEQKNYHKTMCATQAQIKQLTAQGNDITAQINATQQDLSHIITTAEAIAAQESHLEKRKAIYQQWVSLGNWINNELHNLANKQKMVHEDDPSCPLCEQNLSASRRRFLKLNFEKQESFFSHRLKRLKRIIPALKELLIAQHAHITKDKERLQHATMLTTKITELNATQIKINTHIAELTAQCTQLTTTINSSDSIIKQKQHESTQLLSSPLIIEDTKYHELLNKKQLIEQTLQQHVYDENDYKKDQEQLKIIQDQLNEYETLKQSIALQENRKQDIQKTCTTLKKINSEMQALENKRVACGDLAAQLQLLQTKEKELTAEQNKLKHTKELLLQTKGSIENQQRHLQQIQHEFTQEQTTIAQLDIVIDDYQSIATATGKDGIQALLIEEAIPEIEQEANYLLSRLTNNQAHIFIESLRDLKKGGSKETLDINISDQAGIRPYELFSGGEAFRIDFALRIAISKLLARRAGTALQTLIIDEGFGSQDEEGLSHIMDALHKIQDDFSKIIIVSHLPTMKDQFPVHFFVEKGVQGSTITVIEQG